MAETRDIEEILYAEGITSRSPWLRPAAPMARSTRIGLPWAWRYNAFGVCNHFQSTPQKDDRS
jgi:hypothetical protein